MLFKLQNLACIRKKLNIVAHERQHTLLSQKSRTSLGKGQESHPEGSPPVISYKESSSLSLKVKSSQAEQKIQRKDPSHRCSAALKGRENMVPFVWQWILPGGFQPDWSLPSPLRPNSSRNGCSKVFLINVIFPKLWFLFKPKNLAARSQHIFSRAWWMLVQLVHVTKCLQTFFTFKALRKSASLFSPTYSRKSPLSSKTRSGTFLRLSSRISLHTSFMGLCPGFQFCETTQASWALFKCNLLFL